MAQIRKHGLILVQLIQVHPIQLFQLPCSLTFSQGYDRVNVRYITLGCHQCKLQRVTQIFREPKV